MRVKISVLKNTMLLCSTLVAFAAIASLVALFPMREQLSYALYLILALCCAFLVGCIVWDYKTWMLISEKGIEMHRRGKQTVISWEEIKRLEYSGVRWCKLFDVLLIHGRNEVVYVDYTFEKYEEVWDTIQRYLAQGNYPATIDADIPRR